MEIMLGEIFVLQKRQRDGCSKLLKEKGLRPNLENQFEGNLEKTILDSTIKRKFGLCRMSNFFMANLEGALTTPLMFQKRHFMGKI